MALSKYHQKYNDQSDEEIRGKVEAKAQELAAIFQEVGLQTASDPVRLAVLGCGDKRFVAQHKIIFEAVLHRSVEVSTFDITIDHLEGEPNIFQHDCTMPIPNSPYDITYAHVLLKFIETSKQFDLISNSYDALKSGGIAIHCFDTEEITASDTKLTNGQWAVPLEQYKKQLSELDIEYKEIPIKYGIALVLIRK